jgi:PIN domain nuclease of toxin-antitoxin system
MRLLLDTQAFLWFVTDDPHLSARAKALIEDPANERYLSVASAWEIAIKVSIGKMTLTRPVVPFLTQHLAVNSVTLMPIELAHLGEVATLPRHHGDPFDRLIVSQGLAEGMPIVSSDAALDRYGVVRHW